MKGKTMEKQITLPITAEISEDLHIGDFCYLTGEMYVARDAAHKRLMDLIKKDAPLPIRIEGETIYYMGPSPAREGRTIGSAGPTTASRMDSYAPTLLDMGQKGMVGPSGGTRRPILRRSAVQGRFYPSGSNERTPYVMRIWAQRRSFGSMWKIFLSLWWRIVMAAICMKQQWQHIKNRKRNRS